MDTTNDLRGTGRDWKKNGILYPTMLIAAIAVIVFSVVGIATMTGLMPSALSTNNPDAADSPKASPSRTESAAPEARPRAMDRPAPAPRPRVMAAAECADCGVVESIRVVETKGQGTGLGAVTGGVLGGILGNQVGGGRGRTAMTVVGAGAGAYAGHEIEKNMNKSMSYQIRVRMNDGRYRTFYERSQPALSVGQKVRVTSNGIVAAG
jgi:outer membrane lipoprotein SlyB